MGDGLKSPVGDFSGVQAKAEADAEELKTVARQKADAYNAARFELDSVRIAQKQSEEAAAAVTAGKMELKRASDADASADTIAAVEFKGQSQGGGRSFTAAGLPRSGLSCNIRVNNGSWRGSCRPAPSG